MDTVGKVILWIYAIGAVIAVILLIYFIIRRIKIKKKEDFEERDN